MRRIQAQAHATRRARDAEENFVEEMVAAGMGKAPAPAHRPAPITSLRASKDGEAPPEELTEQQDILAGVTTFWSNFMSKTHTPTETAAADARRVLDGVRRWSAGRLPRAVQRALTHDAITSVRNIEVAIRELKRGSTPGVDSMPLEFYLDNITEVAPLLSSLFKEALRVCSPIGVAS